MILVLKVLGIAAGGCIILYLLMIAPRIFRKPDTGAFYNFYYAHRGLFDKAQGVPENSLEAFRRAVENGYGMELDVQLTKDRVPVVFHDSTLLRMCNETGKIHQYTYEELQQFGLDGTKIRIPRLEEVLQLVKGRTPLIVELKMESADLTICSVVDKLLSEYEGLYCIETFNPLGLWWYRIHRPRVVRGQLSTAFVREKEYVTVFHYMLQNLLFNFVGKPDFIAYNHLHQDILSRKIACKLFGAMSVAWTIKSKEELQRSKADFDLFIFEGFHPCR